MTSVKAFPTFLLRECQECASVTCGASPTCTEITRVINVTCPHYIHVAFMCYLYMSLLYYGVILDEFIFWAR